MRSSKLLKAQTLAILKQSENSTSLPNHI